MWTNRSVSAFIRPQTLGDIFYDAFYLAMQPGALDDTTPRRVWYPDLVLPLRSERQKSTVLFSILAVLELTRTLIVALRRCKGPSHSHPYSAYPRATAYRRS